MDSNLKIYNLTKQCSVVSEIRSSQCKSQFQKHFNILLSMVNSTSHPDTIFRAIAKLKWHLLEVSFGSACIKYVWFDFRSLKNNMASPGKKQKLMYDGPNPVDDYLLNQVVKHVNPEELDSMARDLSVDESVYQGIQNPKNRVYKVNN